MNASNSNSNRAIDFGLFLISAATLTLEIHKTRVFSVLLWHHVTYIVVTLTLLGFTAAGAFLTVFPRLAGERVRATLAWSSLGFGLTQWILPFMSRTCGNGRLFVLKFPHIMKLQSMAGNWLVTRKCAFEADYCSMALSI